MDMDSDDTWQCKPLYALLIWISRWTYWCSANIWCILYSVHKIFIRHMNLYSTPEPYWSLVVLVMSHTQIVLFKLVQTMDALSMRWLFLSSLICFRATYCSPNYQFTIRSVFISQFAFIHIIRNGQKIF